MADTTHRGGSGWVPGCACPPCVAGLAAAKKPTLRLVPSAGRKLTYDRLPPAGWANERLSLLALAVALEHLVGEAPDPYAGPSPELDAWFARPNRRAADILVEVANGDARVLRSLAGPVLDDEDERQPGRGLIILAAIRLERGSR